MISFDEWWNKTVGNGQWTTLERLAARDAWHYVQADSDRLAEFAQEVVQWSEAYPTKIFHEPNPEQVNAALNQIGMTFDCFSAMVLRAFTKPWGEKARTALKAHEEGKNG